MCPTSPASLCLDCTARASQDSKYCDQHQTNNRAAAYKQAFGKRQQLDPLYKLYRVARWTQRVRPAVLRRDPLCIECGFRASTVADHIIPARQIVAEFGINAFYELSRLQGMCSTCHAAKSAREGTFAGPRRQ
jgi:5-methylcytosine-specific restriction endonuclease McrA